MNHFPDDIQFISVPLTIQDRQTAKNFAEQQSDPGKQQQVYQNTLAVLATQRYFQMLDIPSNLEKSDSWNATKRKLQDVADLYVPEIKERVECRAIRPGDERCYIPHEVWENRAGYIIVELDDNGYTSTIRGFVPTITVDHLPLSYLRPLDGFFDRLALGPITRLRDWLEGLSAGDWLPLAKLPPQMIMRYKVIQPTEEAQAELKQEIANLYQKAKLSSNLTLEPSGFSPIDTLVALVEQSLDDNIRWKAAELLYRIRPDHPKAATIKAKDLGLYLGGQTVALLVGMALRPDGKALVMARVYPIGGSGMLPSGLTLSGVTQTGETFFEIQSRQHDDFIQFLFTDDQGSAFTLSVSLNTAKVSENFEI